MHPITTYGVFSLLSHQFIVCVRRNGETIYQNVLSSLKAPKGQLKAWKWQFDGSNATYHGLYPRSWTTYDIPELKLRLICKQISPVIPHEYKVKSYRYTTERALNVTLFGYTAASYIVLDQQ